MPSFSVRIGRRSFKTQAVDIATATFEVMGAQGLGFEKFRGVFLDNPTPKADCQTGAPMGRASSPLEPSATVSVRHVPLDSGGYDAGGAYWGLRPRGQRLYAVQDGMGGLAFVDATSPANARAVAFAPEYA